MPPSATPTSPEDPLRNYRHLIERVDAWCRDVVASCPGAVTCSLGCDSCCRHLTLFPVEGAAILAAVAALPTAATAAVRERARRTTVAGPCPLLADGACLLYCARPLICRTHGFPLLLADGAERRIDYCPRNFRGVRTLPAAAVLDLDRLNTALAGVNALFVRETGWNRDRERLTLAEFLIASATDLFPLKNNLPVF